jgi:hypothetical protein
MLLQFSEMLVAGHGCLQRGAGRAVAPRAHDCVSGLGVVAPVGEIHIEDYEEAYLALRA